jgi:hypothetical protein
MVESASLSRAAANVAFQAATLAREIEGGSLTDTDGPDALRLLVSLIRVTSEGNSAWRVERRQAVSAAALVINTKLCVGFGRGCCLRSGPG